MTTLHGFELLQERAIPELNINAKLYRHVETGAELLSVESEDENKTFGVTFRTPPPDSTGLPHIMEHSVLCGSRKYPVKEPFVELVKGSLQTFINAFTFSDKTSYPVASQNVQDFYNLVDVYLDAVFYPRIVPETLQQEGWHYELESLDAPLAYKGVVFNEMKGVYSSPDSLIMRYSESVIFPDTPYGFDSGGDPRCIPDLTYVQFKAFHETYYHPSNARFFFYGDDDPEERLRLLQDYLKDFRALLVESTLPLQPQFDAPQRVSHPYPSGEDAANQKAMLTVNWLLPENNEPVLTFSLEMLDYILVGTPASPLRKALIDSGLGEDVIGGLNGELRQLAFLAGLKGVDPADVDKVERLIMDSLADLVETGIDPATVEAALNTIEFRLREQNYGSFPRGLVLMIRALTTWLHDGDPLAPLAFEGPLSEVKAQLGSTPDYFEQLIETHLLQNPHRVTLVLEPDPELQQQWEAAEKARLAEARAAMDDGALQATVENTRLLKQLQEAPDSPEALATLPHLTLADLDKEVRKVPTAISEAGEVKILHHDLFTNGIVYLNVGLDLHTLPQALLPYVPLFSAALLGIGTESEDFVKLIQRIGQKTGGIRTASLTSAVQGVEQAAAWLFLRGKATVDHTEDLLDILRDVLLTVKLDNRERFMQLLLERKARKEASLIPGGHRIAGSRLRSKLNEADWASEQMQGVSQLFFMRHLVEQVAEDWPAVLDKLEAVRHALVNRGAMICDVTLDAENWPQVQPRLADFLAALPFAPAEGARWSPVYEQSWEGLTIPAQVNYVAKGGNLYDQGYTLDGSVAVITRYLAMTWLWEKIRVQGGAYGAFCSFNQHSGTFSYGSYRDPNLLGTLEAFDQVSAFLHRLKLSDEELGKSIIGAIGGLDAYQLPDAKGYSALKRHLIGYTDEQRQQFRDQVLSTTEADFKAFAEVLDQLNQASLSVILGSEAAIRAANAAQEKHFAVTKVL